MRRGHSATELGASFYQRAAATFTAHSLCDVLSGSVCGCPSRTAGQPGCHRTQNLTCRDSCYKDSPFY